MSREYYNMTYAIIYFPIEISKSIITHVRSTHCHHKAHHIAKTYGSSPRSKPRLSKVAFASLCFIKPSPRELRRRIVALWHCAVTFKYCRVDLCDLRVCNPSVSVAGKKYSERKWTF